MEAKQVKDLMEAYASVYNQSENNETYIAEGEMEQASQVEKYRRMSQQRAQEAQMKKERPRPDTRQNKDTSQIPSRGKPDTPIRGIKDDVDFFDLVKGHLIDEGYADTEEAALAIMANMSEEWKQDIVEAKYGTKAGRKRLAKKIRKGEEIGKSEIGRAHV